MFQTLLTILITAKKNAEGPYTAKDINCKIPAEQIQRFFKKTYTPKICHLCTQKIGRLDFWRSVYNLLTVFQDNFGNKYTFFRVRVKIDIWRGSAFNRNAYGSLCPPVILSHQGTEAWIVNEKAPTVQRSPLYQVAIV